MGKFKINPFTGQLDETGSGGGASSFVDLTDVPSSYSGQAGKTLQVKGAEDGLEFTTPTATDEKVKYDSGDPAAGYVADKFVAGTGITLAEGAGADENKLQITNDDTGSGAVGTHEITYNHTLIATALQSETDPIFTSWLSTTPPLYSETDPVYTSWYNSGSPTLTAITIGANTLDTNEWTNLDGLNQTLATTSSPQFANLIITAGGDIKPSANSTTAINIAQADGTDFVTFDTTNKRVGIGTTSPAVNLEVYSASSASQIYATGSGYQGILTAKSNLNSTNGSLLQFLKSRGSAESPTVVQSGDTLGGIYAYGYSTAGAGFKEASSIGFYIDGTPDGSATDMPGRIVFQTTPDGTATSVERMRITSDGLVGIGTTSPSVPLEVTGQIRSSSNSEGALVAETAIATAGTGATFAVQRAKGTLASKTTVASGDRLGIYLWQGYDGAAYRSASRLTGEVDGTVGSGVVPGRLIFHTTNTSGTEVERMRIDSAGNVGISTTSPQSLLDVQGPAGVGAAAAGILTLATKELTVVDGDQLGRINFNSPLESSGGDSILAGAGIWAEADDTFTSTVNSTELVFGTATTSAAIERMRIDSAGLVGIGTSTPAYRLDIADNVAGEGAIRYLNSSASANSYANLYIGETATGSKYSLIQYLNTSFVASGVNNPNQVNLYSAAGAVNGILLHSQAAAPIRFAINSSEKMRIESDGEIKIPVDGTSGASGCLSFGAGLDGEILHTGSIFRVRSDVVTATDSLELRGGTNGIDFNIGATEQISLIDGVLKPTADSDIDLGTSSLYYKNAFIDQVNTPEVKTDVTSATDLTITTGAAKTLVLGTGVYNDANVGSLVLVTNGTLPGVVEIINSSGVGTGIYSRGFAIGEQGSGSIEIPHDYKEGTNLVFHVHWVGQDAPTGTDNVKWQVTYSITRSGVVTPAVTTDSAETAIDTQYNWYFTDVETITGTNLKIGDQVNFTISRIAAVGDAYAGEAVVATIGFHYQCDTLGSRAISTK